MKNFDTKKSLNTVKQTLSELKQIKTTLLSDADKSEIIEDIDEVIQMALSIKLQNQKEELNHFLKELDENQNKLDAPALRHATNQLDTVLRNISELKTSLNLVA